MTNRSKFTPEEDQKLIYIVSSSPDIKWSKVSELMKNKTSRQCRERYKNYLANGINQSPWTAEEDQILLKAYAEIGPCWSHMKSLFHGRTCVNIKNHYAKIKNKVDKTDKIESPPESAINTVETSISSNQIMNPSFLVNPNQTNTINTNTYEVIPWMITPIIGQFPNNQLINHISTNPQIENNQNGTISSMDDRQIAINSDRQSSFRSQNVMYDYKHLTRKQQVFQQLQMQHQKQLKQAELNEQQSNGEKKGPLYVLPFLGGTNKIGSSPDNLVNLISLKVKNDSKKLTDQEYENSQAINFFENDQDAMLYQHQLTTISEAPSLMLSAENASIRVESPMYEPDSFVENDDFSSIYDFSHDYGDYNTCQDALFIPLG